MKRLASIACLLFALPALAAPLDDSEMQDIIELRHWLHQNPELSNQEFDTAERVAKELRALGYEVHTEIAITGVVGILDTGRDGPTVAVRADMDALPVEDRSGLPFASTATSTYQGNEVPVTHACGHDIHVSVGMGTAAAIMKRKDELRGKVMFVFQPAEEGTPPGVKGGASYMLEEGVFDIAKPDAIFALHSQPDLNVGEVGYKAGPSFASSDQFVVNIQGKQAHGAWPHRARDPIVMAAEAISAIQTIRSRNIDPQKPAVVSVGIVKGGSRYNIIPDSIELQGTVRAYDVAIQDLVEQRLHDILGGITGMHDGSYEMQYKRHTPATVNHDALTAWAGKSLENSLGEEDAQHFPAVMGAEDFAYFANEVPGFYFWLGVTPEGETNSALHTPTMRADDSAIPVGVTAMTGLVTDFLANPPELDE
ncbi:MAG: amidohydrolase [Gammaproteobacteria bacterium]|nr:amidohydrolase [Gammaproteobacteria bacterium]